MSDDALLTDIVSTVVAMNWGFGIIFIACEYGERMTDHFEKFDEKLGRCDFYKLPIEIQRMYLIFSSDTQQMRTVHCYGGVICSREIYKKVQFTFS